tara:strand:+ start:251 stop:559 length:309 start_codon:yes stop_codon:yes gene_type:complete
MRIWEIDRSDDHAKAISVRFPNDARDDEVQTIIAALRGIATDLGDFKSTEDITDGKTGLKKGAKFPFDTTEQAEDFVRRATKHLSGVEISQKSVSRLEVNSE